MTTITTDAVIDVASTGVVVAATPFHDIIKPSSSSDTATTIQSTSSSTSSSSSVTTTTCCDPVVTKSVSSATSTGIDTTTTATVTAGCVNNNVESSTEGEGVAVNTKATSLSLQSSTVMDSPDPKQQPRRNLSKAFDALCRNQLECTVDDEEDTIKEEKTDHYDDLMGTTNNHRSSNKASMLSPNTVVMKAGIPPFNDHNDAHDSSIISPIPPTMNIGSPEITSPFPKEMVVSSVSLPTPQPPTTSSVQVLPEFQLHPDLQLKLSSYTVERVSCYSIIHDINKEATMMASHDPLLLQQQQHACPSSTVIDPAVVESASPLVLQGRGITTSISTSIVQRQSSPSKSTKQQQQHRSQVVSLNATSTTMDYCAVIDEEKWLLASIASRSSLETSTNTSTQCPATFLQAMGEKEYDLSAVLKLSNSNTTTTNNNSSTTTTSATVSTATRTQLWKPSRSWWEAKSGKNPWIEPASHNKRWRYLWPLIHYHKFVHKCIKKLKRNGVDVKVSVTPVSVFLREEVCAISDHLATVSLFGSEEWMDCLIHFNGWTAMNESESIRQYHEFVHSLPLRSLQEPIDVDSPLLRSQIDEAFLRTIANQRDATAAMTSSTMHHYQQQHNATPSVSSSKVTRNQPGNSISTTNTTATAATTHGPPPMYPHTLTHQQIQQLHHSNHLPVPRQINGVRRSRYISGAWYAGHVHPGWENLPVDASSVHSELSANSYPQPPPAHNQYNQSSYLDTATVSAQAAHYHMYHVQPPVGPYYHQQHLNLSHPVPSPHSTSSVDGVGVPSETHSAGYTYHDVYGAGWVDPSMGVHPIHPLYYPTHYYDVPEATETSYASHSERTDEENQPDTSGSDETEANVVITETPYKYDIDQSYTMMSPYWSHLDQATLAMGLATPAVISPATTPRRPDMMMSPVMMSCGGSTSTTTTIKKQSQRVTARGESATEDEASATITETEDEYYVTEVNPYIAPSVPGQRQHHGPINGVPLTNPSHINYYSVYDNKSRLSMGSPSGRHVVPPSPATQFMMSPQAGFAYNYGYGVSPARIPRRTTFTGGNRQRTGSSSNTSIGTTTVTSLESETKIPNGALLHNNNETSTIAANTTVDE